MNRSAVRAALGLNAALALCAALVAGCAQPAGPDSATAGAKPASTTSRAAGSAGGSGATGSSPVNSGTGAEITGSGAGTGTVGDRGGAAQPPITGCRRTSAGLLRRMTAGHNADHDRLTLEFCGSQPPTLRLRYVPAVTADPSDLPVPLDGTAFLLAAIQPATLDTAPRVSDPAQAQRYPGARRITPGYPLLKQVAMAGDVEGVLSVGLGLARPAGVTVTRLTGPARIAIDMWSSPPPQFLGPSRSLAQARTLQTSVDQGHQPWQTDPALVGPAYLGWTTPQTRRLATGLYQFEASGKIAILTLFQPVRPGAGGVWEVSQATVTG